jgi:hypothetical protein
MKRILGITGALLWIIAPVLGFLFLTQLASRQPIEESNTVTVPVRANSEPTWRNVSLEIVRETPWSLLAPDWTGMVQRVLARVAIPIVSGDVIAEVGGVERIAYHSDVPFSILLQVGDLSRDVRMLNTFLFSRGIDADPDSDQFSSLTQRGVRQFARSIGIPDSDGSAFDPSWLVYMADETCVPSLVHRRWGLLRLVGESRSWCLARGFFRRL